MQGKLWISGKFDEDDEQGEERISGNSYFCLSLQPPPPVTVQQYFCTHSHSQQSVHAATQHVNSTVQKCAACHFIGREEQ